MLHHRLRAAAGAPVGSGIPTDGLIAHYTMDNISGSTLIDEQGNYNGTINGATPGAGFLDFDGTNDRVDFGLPAQPQSFSWFVDITPDVIGVDDHLVVMTGGYGAVQLYFDTTSTVKFRVFNGAYVEFSTPISALSNTRLVCQHDGANTEFWKNGSLVGSQASVGAIVYQGTETGRRIGANRNLLSGSFYNGKWFEFIEYNRLLTPSEIAENFS